MFSPLVNGQQKLGLVLPPETESVTLPFTFLNNLIIIPVTINNQITLKFILDTGASNAILTEKIFGDVMDLDYSRTISIASPGVVEEVSAHVVNNVSLRLPKGILGKYMSMLVLEEDYIELQKNLGEEIFGIIGYDVFNRFIVDINFIKSEVTFHDPATFRAPRGYKKINMAIENNKPYIDAIVRQNGESDTLKLMIDTGASHALLLDVAKSDVLTLPDSTLATILGHGLGGEIHGSIGRYQELSICGFGLRDVLVSIPKEGAYSNAIKRGSRNGTIGGHALMHFNVIIDYKNEAFYVRKNGNFRDPFQYDLSGVRVSYFDNPRRYVVTNVIENSPADKAGMMVGDEVISVNGYTSDNSKLSAIYAMLRSRPKRMIKASVMRDGEKLVFKFRLKRMI